MATLGRMFLAAVLERGDVGELLKYGRIDMLFKNDEAELFAFIEQHAAKHGVLPAAKTLAKQLGENLLDLEPEEPPSFYHEKMVNRHLDLALKKGVEHANNLLTKNPTEPAIAFDALLDRLNEAALDRLAPMLHDFRRAGAVVVPEYIRKATAGSQSGLYTGWPSFDNLSGGMQVGDLVSFVGRPATGKTWLMLALAFHAWFVQKRPVLFVSMEIKPLRIYQRLAALATHTPFRNIVRAEIARKVGQTWVDVEGKGKKQKLMDPWERFKHGLMMIEHEEQPFWIVDGNLAATVTDIQILVSRLQPAAVYVDGAYLLGHANKVLTRYARVAENCDGLKRDIAALAPTVASWQFNREITKLKKDERPGLEHVGFTDAIGQHSSVVFGLFDPESPETSHVRRVSLLKGRDGEAGDFFVHWDFHQMDFTEAPNIVEERTPLQHQV